MVKHILLYAASMICINSVSYCQWEIQDSGVDVRLRDVCFVDSLHGWAIGDSATIIATTDGGQTWLKQICPVDTAFPDKMHFVNKDVGYIVGRYGSILMTKDGGETWLESESGLDNFAFWDVFFVNADTGWVVGSNVRHERNRGVILFTQDGGQKWEIQYETHSPDFWTAQLFSATFFIDDQIGWACASDWIDTYSLTNIYFTSNGGLNWSIKSIAHFPVTQINSTSVDTIWLAGPTFSWSHDGGMSWNYNWDFRGDALDIAQISGLSGWVISSHRHHGNHLLFTDDGCINFTEVEKPVDINFHKSLRF